MYTGKNSTSNFYNLNRKIGTFQKIATKIVKYITTYLRRRKVLQTWKMFKIYEYYLNGIEKSYYTV